MFEIVLYIVTAVCSPLPLYDTDEFSPGSPRYAGVYRGSLIWGCRWRPILTRNFEERILRDGVRSRTACTYSRNDAMISGVFELLREWHPLLCAICNFLWALETICGGI